MERTQAIEFLLKHQPMPPDDQATDELFDEYEDVLDHIEEHPDLGFVPLLLGSPGKGKACGLYGRAAGAVFRMFPYEEISAQVLAALGSEDPGVHYWIAYGAVGALDDRTIRSLIEEVPNLRKTLGKIVWEYADSDEEDIPEEDFFPGIDYLHWSRNAQATNKSELSNLEGALIVIEHIPIRLSEAALSENGDLRLPAEVIEGAAILKVGNVCCDEGNEGLLVYRRRNATIAIAGVRSYEVCVPEDETAWYDGTIRLGEMSVRRNLLTIHASGPRAYLAANVSHLKVRVEVSEDSPGELYVFNHGSGQSLMTDREDAKKEAEEAGLAVDWDSIWHS